VLSAYGLSLPALPRVDASHRGLMLFGQSDSSIARAGSGVWTDDAWSVSAYSIARAVTTLYGIDGSVG